MAYLPPLPDPVPGTAPLGARVLGESGPVVVLIHGLGRVAAAWSRVAVPLAEECRVVLPDNPGLGRSSALGVPLSIRRHAHLHAETLQGLFPDEPLHLAGLSLGGMIAPALAAELGTSRCASVLILSSSALETGLFRLSPASMLRVLCRIVRHFSFDHRVNMKELVRPELLQEEPGLAAELDRIQKTEGFRMSSGFRQLLAASGFRIRPLIPRLPERVLVAVGERDRLVPPSHSRRLAHILGAPLCVLPGAGHDLAIDAPEEVVRLVRRMVQGRTLDEVAAAEGVPRPRGMEA